MWKVEEENYRTLLQIGSFTNKLNVSKQWMKQSIKFCQVLLLFLLTVGKNHSSLMSDNIRAELRKNLIQKESYEDRAMVIQKTLSKILLLQEEGYEIQGFDMKC